MDNAGLGSELRRLQDKLGHQLCKGCYYGQPVEHYETLRFIYPDGSVRTERDPRAICTEPPSFCDMCPYRPGGPLEGVMPLGSIEVVRTVRVGDRHA